MTDPLQTDIEAFLAAPSTHDGVAPVRMDTHISRIYLAGDRVLKLKRAVRLPFLDFSSASLRRAACLAEYDVNHDNAPELYLGVSAIIRGEDGALSLTDPRAPLPDMAEDWVVVMRRFDQDSLFSRQLEHGRLDRKGINALVEAVWASHCRAAPRQDRESPDDLAWVIDSNDQTLHSCTTILPSDDVAALIAAQREVLDRQRSHLLQRQGRGLVRRCHGDLHLGNICMVSGRPALFDAIEFSDRIACIDVFYDLSFLLMDLDRHGAKALASHAMNHYLDLSGDYDGVGLLPLFLSLRSSVRSLVAATTALSLSDCGESRGTELANQALSYLEAARSYLTPPPPRLLAVGGFSGSGKSHMGRELAPFLGTPGAAVVRSDAVRKQLMGVPPSAKLGADGYTHDVTERTFATVFEHCEKLLRAGHSVVADAVFANPEHRTAIEDVARRAGVPFNGLWLETRPDVAEHRVATRQGNISDATPEILRLQQSYDIGALTWPRVNTSGTKAQAVTNGRKIIGV